MYMKPTGRRCPLSPTPQIPLRGILKAGGLVFVLKATAGQNARWLKDEATKKDFFLDTTRFPVIKV